MDLEESGVQSKSAEKSCCGNCYLTFRQFYLLLWKNFILQIRRPVGSIFELIIPPLAVLVLVILRATLSTSESVCFTTFPSDPLTVPATGNFTLYYGPNNDSENAVATFIQSMLVESQGVVLGVATQEEFIDAIQETNFTRLSGCFLDGAAIWFNSINETDVEYTIRLRHETLAINTWFTERVARTIQTVGPRTIRNSYLNEGFMQLENIVERAIIQWKMGGTPVGVDVDIRQFPYPSYELDPFLSTLSFILPLFMVCALLYSAGVFVKELVLEKETRIRETMKMMGLSQWILWTTWYLKQLLFLTGPIIIMAIVLKYGLIFSFSNIFLIFVYLFMYIVSGVALCFLISVWFSSARIGLIAGYMLWFVCYFPYLFVAPRYDDLSLGAKVALCFFSNTCVGFGVQVISSLELRQEGVTFGNFALPVSLDDPFHLGWVTLMLAFDAALYLILAWYIDAVKPGKYGVPKPFYFPFLPSYWFSSSRSTKLNPEELSLMRDPKTDRTVHEKEPRGLTVGISIKGLTKIYNRRNAKRRKVAVDQLNLNMYKGQITALLGHNGAGKTTTMSMLTGLFTPTSGTALINGLDVTKDIDLIRRSLGICPQHNVLFDRLTVTEHLMFFSRLKGMPGKMVKQEVEKMIEDLLLMDKKTIKVSSLSGGMKRKLSVGIALVGGSEFVILDEPTSGMDPYARRATWDLLVKHKKGRTILLTTHFMDEADLLGDRIAIMAEGKLKCSGSSLFLKSRYGVGYHMTMVKEPKCDSQVVTDLVKRIVNGAKQVTDVGAELSFILPSQSSSSFPNLFDTLDAHKEDLGISSFGVSVTTMEEVFIKVGEGTDETLETRLLRESTSPLRSPAHSPPPLQEKIAPNTVFASFGADTVGNSTVGSSTVGNSTVGSSTVGNSTVGSSTVGNSTVATTHIGTPTTIHTTTTRTSTETPEIMDTKPEAEIVYNQYAEGEEEVQSVTLDFTGRDDSPSPELMDQKPKQVSSYHEAGRPSVLQLAEDEAGMTSNIKHFDVNTGAVLWFQQFSAIFLKRFYNSKRFWSAIIWQLLIPVGFVLWALILGKTLPGQNSDDPPRVLTLQNTAPSENISLFWVQLGDTSQFNLANGNASVFGATEYFDYSQEVMDLIDSVQNYTDISDCCQYQNQFLDQFCARQTVTDFYEMGNCSDNENFGYGSCLNCLSCCSANALQLSTCTNPLYQEDVSPLQPSDPPAEDYCPTPPSVPIGSSGTGRLDSVNVYVAEHLLNVSADIDPTVFLQRFVAGFVIHPTDPPHSTCGCADNEEETCSFLLSAINLNFTLPVSNNGIVFCPNFPDSVYPEISNCSQFSDDQWRSSYNGLVDLCIDNASCLVAPIQLPPVTTDKCQCSDSSQCQIGMTSQPLLPAGGQQTVTVWYNNQPYHTIASSLNAFYNLYLNEQLGGNRFTITVINHPLPRNLDSQIEDAQTEFLGFTISSTSVLGVSFLFASFIIFLVQEKDSKAKHLQFVSGVQATSYWLGTFAWDMINCILPSLVVFIMFAAFQLDGYKEENLAAVFLLLLLGCYAAVPLTYCFSFLFSNALVAFSMMVVIFYFGSLVLQVVLFVLIIFEPDVVDTVHYLSLVHPVYGVAIGLSDMFTNQGIRETCTQSPQFELQCTLLEVEYVDNVFAFARPGIGHIFLYLFVEGTLFLLLAMLLERELFLPELKQLLCKSSRIAQSNEALIWEGNQMEDDDVFAERKRVASLVNVSKSDALVIKNIVKEYADFRATVCAHWPRCQGEGCKLAVRGVNLIIPNGECFGLLGVNGAGKTTTFKMLTGDITPTSGTALVAGYDIGTELRLVQQRIGYCPQFDALIDRLTGRELLTMFARLRGIPEKEIKDAVKTEIDRLDLRKHADKLCGNYSGGNRRKLSTAVALVGNPPILLLDEPTTGMDPATRRFLWDALTNVIKDGRSVILTSHSMEECEALCTRLAIMVNGQFKCLGSIQHLKSKYGAGYSMQVQVLNKEPDPSISRGFSHRSFRNSLRASVRSMHSRSKSPPPVSPIHTNPSQESVKHQQPLDPFDISNVHAFIRCTFPGSVLLEQHQGSVTYQVPSEGVTWSQMFKEIEANKERLNIIDYSVSQTTLDQVFINFAKEQHEE